MVNCARSWNSLQAQSGNTISILAQEMQTVFFSIAEGIVSFAGSDGNPLKQVLQITGNVSVHETFQELKIHMDSNTS